ncbi:MAG: LysM peptidoglycan-binding domain-containing protein [Bacteroidaceae bacterium]|nr:LysM peptidoglycan-binding domain-containing protein [Bacteroidaceae bacterium]
MKKIALFLVAIVLAVTVNAQQKTMKREIQSGETLYSIARQHNVSVSTLLELNPGLQADHIMAGQKINVPALTQQGEDTPVVEPQTQTEQSTQPVQQANPPQPAQQQTTPQPVYRPKYKTKHEVLKKETLYSISRQYGITEDQLRAANPSIKKDKVKKGSILNIPYTIEEDNKYQEEQRRLEEEAKKPKVEMYPTIKVAVILPFSANEATMSSESQKMANIYQGFLLAVDSLKQRGCSVEVFAYDEAVSDRIFTDIMSQPEMKEMQLIVGPIRQYHVSTVAKFAHQYGITHVVPLSNEPTLVNEHPTTFQVNVSSSLLHTQAYNRFASLHKSANIIFVNMGDRGDNHTYITGFKQALDQQSIPYSTLSITEIDKELEKFKTGVRNILIPSSPTSAAFENLCKKLDGLNIPDEKPVQLFGYPEWQTLATKHTKHLSKYNCQYFTTFYSNNGAARTQTFNSRFRRWFHQDQYNSIPRYGELGYDIGAYFIKGLNDYGSTFHDNLHSYTYFSLEFPFNFEKKNQWSGYQNKALLIVTHRNDGTVHVSF